MKHKELYMLVDLAQCAAAATQKTPKSTSFYLLALLLSAAQDLGTSRYLQPTMFIQGIT